MKEDLLVTFICSTISMITILIGFLFMLSPGKHGVNFYMCSGEDPRIDPYDYGKVFSFGFWNLFNFIIWWIDSSFQFQWPFLVYCLSILIFPIFFCKTTFKKPEQLVSQPQITNDSTVDLVVLIVSNGVIVWSDVINLFFYIR